MNVFFLFQLKISRSFYLSFSVLLSLLFSFFHTFHLHPCVCISSSADKIAHFQAGDIRRALVISFFPSQMMSTTVRLSQSLPKEMEDIQGRKKVFFGSVINLKRHVVCAESHAVFAGSLECSRRFHGTPTYTQYSILCDYMKTNETENWWRRSDRELAYTRSSDITHRQSPLWAICSFMMKFPQTFRTVKNNNPSTIRSSDIFDRRKYHHGIFPVFTIVFSVNLRRKKTVFFFLTLALFATFKLALTFVLEFS